MSPKCLSFRGIFLTVQRLPGHIHTFLEEPDMHSMIAFTFIVLSIGIFMAHAMEAFRSGGR
jgi:hypothetical protein